MKPILFNTDMVKALLEGRKTVTRRLIKPQPGADANLMYAYAASHKQDIGKWQDCKTRQSWNPPFHADDILYVRETWQYGYHADGNGNLDYETGQYFYAADDPNPFNCWIMPDGTERDSMPWRPSIHMPKDAARIFLRVTKVRVERLQAITEAEALKEGCEGLPCDHPGRDEHGCVDCMNTGWLEPPSLAFMELWDSTIPKHPHKFKSYPYYWKDNPWVWVIEFERISKEEALK